jgi:hypothetical protein
VQFPTKFEMVVNRKTPQGRRPKKSAPVEETNRALIATKGRRRCLRENDADNGGLDAKNDYFNIDRRGSADRHNR